MSEYREPPAPKPAVFVIQEHVLVIDPRSGRLVWTQAIGGPITRLLVVEDRLFLFLPNKVFCFHLDSGRHLGGMDLPFPVKAAVAHAGFVMLAGDEGSLCLGLDGSVIWSVGLDPVPGTRYPDLRWKFVCKDGKGAQLWESEATRPRQHPPGLAAGEQVAQPDLIGRH